MHRYFVEKAKHSYAEFCSSRSQNVRVPWSCTLSPDTHTDSPAPHNATPYTHMQVCLFWETLQWWCTLYHLSQKLKKKKRKRSVVEYSVHWIRKWAFQVWQAWSSYHNWMNYIIIWLLISDLKKMILHFRRTAHNSTTNSHKKKQRYNEVKVSGWFFWGVISCNIARILPTVSENASFANRSKANLNTLGNQPMKGQGSGKWKHKHMSWVCKSDLCMHTNFWCNHNSKNNVQQCSGVLWS